MSKYKNLTDKELLKLYITKIKPNQSQSKISNTVKNLFKDDKNLLDLLSTINRDKFFDNHVKEIWKINRAIYYRANQESTSHLKHFENINSIDSYLKAHFHGIIHEEAFIIAIDNNNNIIDQYTINIGNQVSTIINIKEIIKWAIETNASGIILTHNHPHGNVNPSIADIATSKQLANALSLIDVALIDSIIVNENKKFSLANAKLIE